MQTVRKSLWLNGLPWHLRAVRWMLRREHRRSVDPVAVMDENYPVIKELRALRALSVVAAAPERSIHGGELCVTR